METLPHNPPVFASQQEFIEWLKVYAEPQLTEYLEAESAEFVAKFQAILEKYTDVRGDYGMLKIASTLGQSTAELLMFVNQASGLNSEADKKAFVTSSAIALFRLIEHGKSASEKNVARISDDADLPPLFDEQTSMEDTFVRPLVEQAIKESQQILKDLNNACE